MDAEDTLQWLLEPDLANPGVRYFALQDLVGLSREDPQVCLAQAEVMDHGPVPSILAAQHEEGYWVKPGSGYSPKYQAAVWQILFLAELGADPADARVRKGCEYLLSHSTAANGGFSCYNPPTPRGALHCLNGNLLAALIRLGYGGDERVVAALDWQVQAVSGDGQVEYFASTTSGPGFACGVNLGQPCGWGAVKALKAFAALPPALRSPAVDRAAEVGVEFLLSRDPAQADYPYTNSVNPAWFNFGFPSSYWSDVLEAAAVLADLGYGRDPRLANAFRFILSKRDARGRWKLEKSLNRKMWHDIEKKGKPSKWITLRALKVLKAAGSAA